MQGVAYPVAQFDLTPILTIVCLVLLAALGAAFYFLINKSDEVRELKAAYDRIMRSFQELDEQAKLIVKTDLELNKAQEELDRRLKGLNTLQKLARGMHGLLDENEAFRRVSPELMAELGFNQALIATIADDDRLIARLNIGFDEQKVFAGLTAIERTAEILDMLRRRQTIASLSLSKKMRAFVAGLFDTEHFIIAPILTQKGLAGFLLVANRNTAAPANEGDEELISILASQVAHAVETAQLFEQVYRSSQMLEMKVTERTRELSRALDQVRDISRKKSEFISAVSHELRTPLTSIKGYASLLMSGKAGAVPESIRERLGKINTHSDNLVKLINDLLDIARIESGRVEMRTRAQDIKHMLDNIADLLTPQLTAKGVNFRVNVPADTPEAEFDTSQVERVFINLISNAIKFTPAHGDITINVIPCRETAELLCEVADSGIGIKKEDLARIFDEFYRVENEINATVKGTGLGLALAKNIVEAHNGRMWVTSEVGTGTTFHFTLPLIHRPAAANPSTAA